MNPTKKEVLAMAKRKKSTYERLRDGEKLKQWERKEVERQFGAEDPGWEVVHRDVAGIDVGNESHFAAVDPKLTQPSVREFGSWTAGLQAMADWFKQCGVKRVVMTSAANAASPSSYTEAGVTDETLWTDPEDPTIIPYRRSKTVAEKAAWDFMASYAGPMTLATVLPGAVFGPILSTDSIGSVQIIERILKGSMPGSPRIGLEIVDVRDLVDIHVRAMTAPGAAGQRFLATGEFTWMREMAKTLRDGLGPAGAKVSTRQLPDWVVRLTSVFDKSLREITVSLGRRNRHTTEKAERLLGWRPRPAAPTVIDCANSLIAHGVV